MEVLKQSDFSPSDRIFKWWTIITLATDVAILLFRSLFHKCDRREQKTAGFEFA